MVIALVTSLQVDPPAEVLAEDVEEAVEVEGDNDEVGGEEERELRMNMAGVGRRQLDGQDQVVHHGEALNRGANKQQHDRSDRYDEPRAGWPDGLCHSHFGYEWG